jgi:hypothetical protein
MSSIAAESARARLLFAIPRLVAKAIVARRLVTLPPSPATANFELFDDLMTVSHPIVRSDNAAEHQHSSRDFYSEKRIETPWVGCE